jgi:hypothetical protein
LGILLAAGTAPTAALDGRVNAPQAADWKWSLVQSPASALELRFPNAGTLAQADASSASPTPLAREFGDRSSYVIPALEILGFDVLVNRYNYRFGAKPEDYRVTAETVKRNLRGGWVTDNDPFSVNQFAHPYQGAMYHGFARSAGLGYWESSAYTFLGAALWEIAGESTPPSINDLVASGIAGSFFGEPLFRMASLVLENGAPGLWREIFAAVISPPVGLNRLAFGDRFAPIFSSRGAAYYSRLQLGFSHAVQGTESTSNDFKRNEFVADFSMQYGLPGKPGYEYTRPFDYFTFDVTGSSASVFDAIGTRGLLIGRTYGEGDDSYRGIWGLYGSYDYIAPQTYRISTTALSIGTTAQWWLARMLAFQASALVGVGYGAVGTLHVRTENDYHYGTTPQAMLLLRLIYDDKAALDVNARDFFVRGVSRGNDNIARADVSFTWRLYKQHALSMKYLWNRRDSSLPILGSRAQTVATLGVFYTYVGREGFSAVDWR